MKLWKRATELVIVAALLATAGCSGKTKKEEPIPSPTATETPLPTEEPEEYPGRAKVDPAQITYADSYSFEKIAYAGMEEAEFFCRLEAEEATAVEGVALKTDQKGYSGIGYLDITDNTKFSMQVTLPASQYYIYFCHNNINSRFRSKNCTW